MKYYAFQVFYLGENYQGFQRQLNGQTVENYIEYALISSNLIHSFQENDYKNCSRTDQGVNSLANVFVISCDNHPLLPQINSYLPHDILVWSYVEVGAKFNPRKKVRKHYRYYLNKKLIPQECDLNRIYDFVGTYDFKSFLKKHGAGMDYSISQIFSIEITDTKEFHCIDIEGDRFGREQIRRMIGFLIQLKFAETSPRRFLENPIDLDVKAVPGEFLILMNISYHPPLVWKYDNKLEHQINIRYHQLKSRIHPKYTQFDLLEGLLNLI